MKKTQMKVWKDKSGKYESIPTVWAGMGEKRRRGLRILPKSKGYFVHVTSRTAGKAFLFGSEEKRVLVGMIRQWAAFSQLGVVTHCVMDNHFHVMLWVPGYVKLTHAELRDHLMLVWPQPKVDAWELAYQKQKPEVQKSMDAAVLARMGDLPEFMRVLKQSFSCWFNRTHDREGTLWDTRYRSVVVENQPLALLSVAAYIDLNPLRAGIITDPMHYAWSGYGAAVSGDMKARSGLQALVSCSKGRQPDAIFFFKAKSIRDRSEKSWSETSQEVALALSEKSHPKSWQEVHAAYRLWLISKGDAASDHRHKRKNLDPALVLESYEKMGDVPISVALHHKMRCFSHGVALGSPGFLEELMSQYPDSFSAHPKKIAKEVKGISDAWFDLRQVD